MTIDPGNLQFGQTPSAPVKKTKAKKTATTTTTVSKPGAVESTKITTPASFGLPQDIMPEKEIEKTFTTSAPFYGNAPITTPSDFGMGADLPSVPTLAGDTVDTSPTDSTGSNNNKPIVPGENVVDLTRQDSFQFIINALKPYGLEGVGEVLNDLRQDRTIGPAKAEYIIKYDTSINPKTGKPYNEAYSKRFAGNFERIKNGLPAYSEGEYMAYENQYRSSLNALGYGNLANKANIDNWIAKTVSPSEVASRVELAATVSIPVQQVLKGYLPSLATNDIVTALLDTTTGLPALKQKIERAKVGAAASAAGLAPLTESRAEELLQANVTEAEAQAGFRAIQSGAERGRQLASMQGEQGFSQMEAENLVFGLAGYQQAEEKAKRIASRERALAQGKSGLTAGALNTGRAGAF